MAWIDVPHRPGAIRAQALSTTPVAEAPRWYAIRNAADADEAEVLLYDAIGGWFGVFADEFLAELRQITAPRMRVRINSPGGSVFEGIAIANALRAHPATVTVQVDGIAASVASVIAMAGDRVEMAPNSMLMIHEASGACMGPASEMTKMAEVLDLISENISNAYADRSGSDAAGWRDAMRAETWYLPDTAVKAGLADVALSAVPESPNAPEEPEENNDDELAEELAEARMHARWDLTAYGYQGPPAPEYPKPGPPPAKDTPHAGATPSLLMRVEDLLDEATVQALRAAVRERGAEAAATEFGATTEPPAIVSPESPGTDPGEDEVAGSTAASPEAPESAAAQPEATTEPTDGWAADVAALTTEPADAWAADLTHLTGPDASSSAATAA